MDQSYQRAAPSAENQELAWTSYVCSQAGSYGYTTGNILSYHFIMTPFFLITAESLYQICIMSPLDLFIQINNIQQNHNNISRQIIHKVVVVSAHS